MSQPKARRRRRVRRGIHNNPWLAQLLAMRINPGIWGLGGNGEILSIQRLLTPQEILDKYVKVE